MVEPEEGWIGTSALRLHYVEWSKPDLPAALLLHGIGDNGRIWDSFARLASPFLRIIALDQRGHGLSEWAVPPAYSESEYVSDLCAAVEHLKLDRFVLIGHSMGALHATRYAMLRPERVSALVHADIEPRPPDWNRKYLLNLYDEMPATYTSPEDYASGAGLHSPRAKKELLLEFAAHALARSENGLYRPLFDREVLRSFDGYDLVADLPRISCPVLAVRGENSRVMSRQAAEEMSRAVPNGRFAEIPGAAHPVQTEDPEAFTKIVLDFLRETGIIENSK
ncbi:MAG: alpha/beta hydrolase [Syntrophales bacterium]|nr:alpha/beta hydrolase [Syntrophales bacterium]MDD5534053.1 alpha/beta hydrolase [Syntrophales bacterium]